MSVDAVAKFGQTKACSSDIVTRKLQLPWSVYIMALNESVMKTIGTFLSQFLVAH